MRCNNDHGLSPDGKWLAISDQSEDDGRSVIFVLPAVGRDAEARDREEPLLLARLVARREDPRLLRGARRRVRRVHDPGRGGRGDAAHHRPRPRRRPGLRPGRAHLVQLGAHRGHEDLAHGPRREEPGADDAQRGVRRLVPPPLARREAGRLPLLRPLGRGPPGEQGRRPAADAERGRRAEGDRAPLRRPGDDQRAVLVPRQPAASRSSATGCSRSEAPLREVRLGGAPPDAAGLPGQGRAGRVRRGRGLPAGTTGAPGRDPAALRGRRAEARPADRHGGAHAGRAPALAGGPLRAGRRGGAAPRELPDRPRPLPLRGLRPRLRARGGAARGAWGAAPPRDPPRPRPLHGTSRRRVPRRGAGAAAHRRPLALVLRPRERPLRPARGGGGGGGGVRSRARAGRLRGGAPGRRPARRGLRALARPRTSGCGAGSWPPGPARGSRS